MERARPSDDPLPDAKRSRITLSIHSEFTADEKNQAREANQTSPLLRLNPQLLDLLMNSDPHVQRTFYHACRYLSMKVQDINSPSIEGGALKARIRVVLHDELFENDKEFASKRNHRGKKMFSTSNADFSLIQSRFALRNIHLNVDTNLAFLTPGAVVIFQNILAANPAIYSIDYCGVNDDWNFESTMNKLNRVFSTKEIFRTGVRSIDTRPLTNLRKLCVGRYMSLCANNTLLFLFYPHPNQLTNLEELYFSGESPDTLTNEYYGWLAKLPKLRKLSVSSDSNASPSDMMIQMSLHECSSLRSLSLRRARANQQFWQSLSSLQNLKALAENGDFPVTSLPTLPLLTNLTSLKLTNCSQLTEITRIPNLSHLTLSGDTNFGALASSSSLKTLAIEFVNIDEDNSQRENMMTLSALTQLETIIIRDPCSVIDYQQKVGRGKLIDPQVFNALPRLANLIFHGDDRVIDLPLYRRDLKDSIEVTNRKGKLTFADGRVNLEIAQALANITTLERGL